MERRTNSLAVTTWKCHNGKHGSHHLKLTTDQLGAVIEDDPLIATEEKLSKEHSVNLSTVIWHLKQIGQIEAKVKGNGEKGKI